MLVAKTMHSIECLVGRAALKFLYGGTQGADVSRSGTGGWRLHLHGGVPNTEQTSVGPLRVSGDRSPPNLNAIFPPQPSLLSLIIIYNLFPLLPRQVLLAFSILLSNQFFNWFSVCLFQLTISIAIWVILDSSLWNPPSLFHPPESQPKIRPTSSLSCTIVNPSPTSLPSSCGLKGFS